MIFYSIKQVFVIVCYSFTWYDGLGLSHTILFYDLSMKNVFLYRTITKFVLTEAAPNVVGWVLTPCVPWEIVPSTTPIKYCPSLFASHTYTPSSNHQDLYKRTVFSNVKIFAKTGMKESSQLCDLKLKISLETNLAIVCT